MEKEVGTATDEVETEGRDRKAWITAMETVVISGIAVLVFYTIYPADPMLTTASFPWPILVPLVMGLRYGLVHGAGSAAILVFAAMWFYFGGATGTELPLVYVAGLLVVGVVSGQAYDRWFARYQDLDQHYADVRHHFDGLRRDYHLLRLSHGDLEQRLIGARGSLREALAAVQSAVVSSDSGSELSPDLAWKLLRVFADYGGVQSASVYRVDAGRKGVPVTRFVAAIGVTTGVSVTNEAIASVMSTGKPVVLNKDSVPEDGLLAAIPLIDSDGHLLGLVAVSEIAFLDFNDRTIDLLTMVASHIADLISFHGQLDARPGCSREVFQRAIKRSVKAAGLSGMPSGLIYYQSDMQSSLDRLCVLLSEQLRHTDCFWIPEGEANTGVVAELLMYADMSATEQHVLRLDREYMERWGTSLEQAGIKVLRTSLDAETSPDQHMYAGMFRAEDRPHMIA